MHKVLAYLSPIIFLSMACAHEHTPRLFHGFSVTGAVGGMAGQLETTHDLVAFMEIIDTGVRNDEFSATVTENDALDLFNSSWTGYISWDYGYQARNGFVFGLSAVAGFEHLTFKESSNVYTFSGDTRGVYRGNVNTNSLDVELTNDFALLFKPGFVLHDHTMIYALIGPRWGYINRTMNSFDGSEGIYGHQYFYNQDSEFDYELGFTAGVGVKQSVSDRVIIGLEYAYTHYSNFDTLSVPYAFRETFSGDGITTVFEVSGMSAYEDLELITNNVVATISYRF